jgi:hypothetical protein
MASTSARGVALSDHLFLRLLCGAGRVTPDFFLYGTNLTKFQDLYTVRALSTKARFTLK